MKCGYSLSIGNDLKSVAKLAAKVQFHCCLSKLLEKILKNQLCVVLKFNTIDMQTSNAISGESTYGTTCVFVHRSTSCGL